MALDPPFYPTAQALNWCWEMCFWRDVREGQAGAAGTHQAPALTCIASKGLADQTAFNEDWTQLFWKVDP